MIKIYIYIYIPAPTSQVTNWNLLGQTQTLQRRPVGRCWYIRSSVTHSKAWQESIYPSNNLNIKIYLNIVNLKRSTPLLLVFCWLYIWLFYLAARLHLLPLPARAAPLKLWRVGLAGAAGQDPVWPSGWSSITGLVRTKVISQVHDGRYSCHDLPWGILTTYSSPSFKTGILVQEKLESQMMRLGQRPLSRKESCTSKQEN